MKSKLIYLASPYTHGDPAVVQRRFDIVQSLTGELLKRNVHVFSPICYSHQFALLGAGGDWQAWMEFDKAMIAHCDKIAVLCLDGWTESKGVDAEIKQYCAIWPDDPIFIYDTPRVEVESIRDDLVLHVITEITWPTIDSIVKALK